MAGVQKKSMLLAQAILIYYYKFILPKKFRIRESLTTLDVVFYIAQLFQPLGSQ